MLIENKMYGESYHKIIHPSGLTVLLYPIQEKSTINAMFATKYGSIHKPVNTDIPDGIAHFLEHKLFENEQGDAFTLFAPYGASANAYTSFDRTCYLFSCTSNFKENLEILLKFVREPYFTPETVEKEQGIIGQEITMYRDNPGWRVFFGMLQSMYASHPLRVDFAGTIESISEINPDLLYKCYKTYYTPANMVLCVSGGFDVDDALAVIDAVLPIELVSPEAREASAPEAEVFDEQERVARAYDECSLAVAQPLFNLGFKLAPVGVGQEAVKAVAELEVLLSVVSSEVSDLYTRLYDEGLINPEFGAETMFGNGYALAAFSGESKDPAAVERMVVAELERFKSEGIPADKFELCKRIAFGGLIRESSSGEAVCSELLQSFVVGAEYFDKAEILANMTLKDVGSRLRTIDVSNRSLFVVRPL